MTPVLGTQILLQARFPGQASATRLMFGTNNGVGTPLDAIGASGCSLLLSDIFFTAPLQPSTSTACATEVQATTAFSIPSDPNLIGLSFSVQAGAVVPGANPLGIALTNRGNATIGI